MLRLSSELSAIAFAVSVTYVDAGRQQWPRAAIHLIANWLLPRAAEFDNHLTKAEQPWRRNVTISRARWWIP